MLTFLFLEIASFLRGLLLAWTGDSFMMRPNDTNEMMIHVIDQFASILEMAIESRNASVPTAAHEKCELAWYPPAVILKGIKASRNGNHIRPFMKSMETNASKKIFSKPDMISSSPYMYTFVVRPDCPCLSVNLFASLTAELWIIASAPLHLHLSLPFVKLSHIRKKIAKWLA